MGVWKDCCNNWFRKQKPRHPKDGTFQEVHNCPTCKTSLGLIFNCAYLDDNLSGHKYSEDVNELVCKVVNIVDKTK